MLSPIVNIKVYRASNEVFKRLNNLRRWTDLMTENRYNELAKQGLNCIVAFFIAAQLESDGEEIDWDKFPRIVLYRCFQKAYVNFDTPEQEINEICEMGGIDKSLILQVTTEYIGEKTSPEFAEFLSEANDPKSIEYKIYQAARRLATYVEVVSLENNYQTLKFNDNFEEKKEEILESIRECSKEFPILQLMVRERGRFFQVLLDLSRLRNQYRWNVISCTCKCSVLGHLLDTGILAYLMTLEKKEAGENVDLAKSFFLGIFHDVAENWTKDIPSPIKDRIPGFREATELYELHMIDEKLYYNLSENMVKKLKTVMMEDESNESYKKFMKGADYLSADCECWRQYISGCQEKYFYLAMNRFDFERAELTPIAKELHFSLIKEVEEFIRPIN